MVKANTQFRSAEAYSDGKNVWIKWQMMVETQNFGFNVYAVSGGTRRKLNDGPILGGATKLANRPVFGGQYEFLASGKEALSQFVIETFPMSGAPVASDGFSAARVSDLNALSGFSSDRLLPKNLSATGKIEKTALTPESDLQSEIAQSLLSPDPDMQKWVAAQPGVKIGVRSEGIYRVTKAQLQAAGFDTNSDPTTWQLFVEGHEQSINVAANGDYIEFYGKGIDTVESDARIYYLLAGPSPGKRMTIRKVGPSLGTALSRSYNQTFVNKERTIYINTVFNGDAENYFGSVISASPHTFNFNLSGIDQSTANGAMSIKLQGFSFTPHPISVTLNGHVLSPMSGNLAAPFSADYTIPVAFLNEGGNSLILVSTAGGDISLFDQFSITFNRTYLAKQNSLSFFTQNYKVTQLTGFTSSNVRVFDTTFDGDPIILTGLNFQNAGGIFGTRVPAYRGRLMYAVEDSAVQSPASIDVNNASTLSTPTHSADLVIVTYKDFETQANAWADYRRGQGFSVEVVDVADIFDEFNYGVLSSDAIKDFLLYTRNNWQTPPHYVLLLGDATYDPRNYQGFASSGAIDYVPVKIVTTIFSETASDDAFADFNNDGLAQMAVGRIPARDTQTVTNALNKTTTFEQANRSLNDGVLFVHDYDPPTWDFPAESVRLSDLLPAGTPSTLVGRTDLAGNVDPQGQQNLINAINTGKFVVNYAGHGSTGIWFNTNFFGINNVTNCTGQPTCINNPGRESIFLSLSCLNGYFIRPEPGVDSLSEVLLKAANGGAVAVWSSTGETTPDVQEEMGQRFYSQLGTSTTMTRMGDFMLDAKTIIPGGPDVRLTFSLLGDPMLKIKQ